MKIMRPNIPAIEELIRCIRDKRSGAYYARMPRYMTRSCATWRVQRGGYYGMIEYPTKFGGRGMLCVSVFRPSYIGPLFYIYAEKKWVVCTECTEDKVMMNVLRKAGVTDDDMLVLPMTEAHRLLVCVANKVGLGGFLVGMHSHEKSY